MKRRKLLAGAASAAILHGSPSVARPVRAPTSTSYASFLSEIRAQASVLGISASVLDDALSLDRPDVRVLDLDRHQPEFTLSWSAYRQRVLTTKRLDSAHAGYRQRLPLLTGIWQRYRVDPRIVVGIWGLESNFGQRIGTFGIVDALATLAFDGRRASFFRAELLNALRILQQHDVSVAGMLGSYAGAMGQPQFMPSSYLRYAVDYDGDGRRDIWTSEPDVFASISNYLARNGWLTGAPWGQEISVPPEFETAQTGRQVRRKLGTWMGMGVRRIDGGRFTREDVVGAILLPEGARGDAFMVYDNFDVIRRYNPSDFYSLAVGLLGSAAA